MNDTEIDQSKGSVGAQLAAVRIYAKFQLTGCSMRQMYVFITPSYLLR